MSLGPYSRRLLRAGLEGLAGEINDTVQTGVKSQFEQAQNDWRVKLTLGDLSLYDTSESSILRPLRATGGVVFPYTPQISVSYSANYDAADLTHANYRVYQYKNSAIDSINITANFTAQDTHEANYLLAVIHFFKTVTKMFYGQDSNPVNGTPPPVCFLSGYGTYQFNNHPLVITNFTQVLPDKVDYIRAQHISMAAVPDNNEGENSTGDKTSNGLNAIQRLARLGLALLPGGMPAPPAFSPPRPGKFDDATYVPTEMQIQVQALPVMSRKMISNEFSLHQYANGSLNKKGIW